MRLLEFLVLIWVDWCHVEVKALIGIEILSLQPSGNEKPQNSKQSIYAVNYALNFITFCCKVYVEFLVVWYAFGCFSCYCSYGSINFIRSSWFSPCAWKFTTTVKVMSLLSLLSIPQRWNDWTKMIYCCNVTTYCLLYYCNVFLYETESDLLYLITCYGYIKRILYMNCYQYMKQGFFSFEKRVEIILNSHMFSGVTVSLPILCCLPW